MFYMSVCLSLPFSLWFGVLESVTEEEQMHKNNVEFECNSQYHLPPSEHELIAVSYLATDIRSRRYKFGAHKTILNTTTPSDNIANFSYRSFVVVPEAETSPLN